MRLIREQILWCHEEPNLPKSLTFSAQPMRTAKTLNDRCNLAAQRTSTAHIVAWKISDLRVSCHKLTVILGHTKVALFWWKWKDEMEREDERRGYQHPPDLCRPNMLCATHGRQVPMSFERDGMRKKKIWLLSCLCVRALLLAKVTATQLKFEVVFRRTARRGI